MRNTLEELRRLIETTFEIDPAGIDPEKSIIEYGLDSLALTELLFAAEDHFGVDLSERDESVTTLAGLAAMIDRKQRREPVAEVRTSPSVGE